MGEGDRGPNTGGMGAFAPAASLSPPLVERAMAEILRPAVAGMAAEGSPYRGILYAGLMLTAAGPQLIEFNVRFGDPECQVLLPRLMTDLGQLLLGAAEGRARPHGPALVPRARADRGDGRAGLSRRLRQGQRDPRARAAAALEGVTIFHAGTRIEDGRVLADGGRVLNVTGQGATLAEARERAYAAIDLIDWPEGFCRRDIGAGA